MRLPSENASSIVHLGFAGFTYSSLTGWARIDTLSSSDRAFLTELANALKPQIDTVLKETRDTQEALVFARPQAQAAQNIALTGMRRVVREALTTVQQKIGNDSPDHPAVRRFLPNLLATITERPIDERPSEVQRAVARLRTLDAFDGRDVLCNRLEAAATAANEAISAAGAVLDGWRKERSEEVVAKGALRIALEKTHRSLGAHFAGQRDFVESFFLKATGPSEGSDEHNATSPAVPTNAPHA